MNETQELDARLEASSFVEGLFDNIPDVVFFLKNREGLYQLVNKTLVDRCGSRSKKDLIGRTAAEIFPPPLGERYFEQDLRVCTTGAPITGELELHLYPNGLEGWCLTDKRPLFGSSENIIGVVGISRDLHSPGEGTEGYRDLAAAIEHVQTSFGQGLRVEEMAEIAGLSVYQLNRRLSAILKITASQLFTKTRIDAASRMLRDSRSSISEIAFACGYNDQSAFSRRFRQTVGLTPQQYRKRHSG